MSIQFKVHLMYNADAYAKFIIFINRLVIIKNRKITLIHRG